MKQFYGLGYVLLAGTLMLLSSNAQAIQKCKDSEGKWHYGDNAEEACANSKVTTLTKRGFVKETLDAPKTDEEREIEAQAQRQEQEELARIKAEQDERNRILSIYERESDIDRQRDNQLASVDGNIRVHQAYLKQMDGKIQRLETKIAEAKEGRFKEGLVKELTESKSRVEEFSTELKRLEIQKVNITDKFANEKKLYRELKGA